MRRVNLGSDDISLSLPRLRGLRDRAVEQSRQRRGVAFLRGFERQAHQDGEEGEEQRDVDDDVDGERQRDVAAGNGVLVRRLDRDKQTVALTALAAELPTRLADYQAMLFQRALDFRDANTHKADTYDEFKAILEKEGGFLLAPWCGSADCERQINTDTSATIRCIPFDSPDEAGRCLIDGKPSERRVLFARAY